MYDPKEFTVQLTATAQHTYTVIARTEEEAISAAEGLLDDGEFGEVSAPSIEYSDAWPSDEDQEEPDEDWENEY